MNLFGRVKSSKAETGSGKDPEQAYRLYKLVNRAWGAAPLAEVIPPNAK